MNLSRHGLRALSLAWHAFAALGLLVVVVTATPLVSWWAQVYAGDWNDPSGEILVVLAADNLDVDVVGQRTYWRTVYAVLAERQTPFKKIVFSGGPAAEGGVSASELMRDLAVSQGVDASLIELETKSSSTRENAIEVERLLHDEIGRARIVLLTSDFHMLRARLAFEKAGVPVVPRPFPDVLKRCVRRQERWGAFLEMSWETGKLGGYWLNDWI